MIRFLVAFVAALGLNFAMFGYMNFAAMKMKQWSQQNVELSMVERLLVSSGMFLQQHWLWVAIAIIVVSLLVAGLMGGEDKSE